MSTLRGSYPWVFKRGRLVALREILTLGEGFNTQVVTLRCFNIVVLEKENGTAATGDPTCTSALGTPGHAG